MESLAGKRQGQIIAATIGNFDAAREAMEQMGKSAGSADREMDIVTQSIEFKMNALKETFVGIGQNLFQRDQMGAVVDGFTSILEVIDKVTEKIGLFGTAAIGAGITAFIKNFSGVKAVVTDAIGAFNLIKGMGLSNIASGITLIQVAFSNLAATIGISTAAFGGFLAIAAGIAAIVGGVIAYKNHMENLRKSADESAKSFDNSNKSLEDQAARVEELRGKLADANTSEAEAYEIKSELLGIQSQLAESYGTEAEGLDLVNGKLDDQIDKLLSLNKAEAERYLTENHKAIKNAENELYGNRIVDLGQNYLMGTGIESVFDKYKDKGVGYSPLPTGEYVVYFNGNADDAKQVLYDLMSDIRETFGDEMPAQVERFYNSVSDRYQDVNQVIKDNINIVEQAKTARMKLDEQDYSLTEGAEDAQTATKWLYDYADAIDNYNKALASGDDTKIQQAKTAFEELDGTLQQLTQGDMADYRAQYEQLNDKLNKTAIAQKQFTDGLKGTGDSSELQKYAEGLKQLEVSAAQFKEAFLMGDKDAEGFDFMQKIADEAVNLGVISDTTSGSIESLADVLVSKGILSADAVQNVGQSVTSTTQTIEEFAETATSSIDAVNAALASNTKATGLSKDEIENLKKAFKDVKGFDPAKLFVNTANGVKVNTEELRKLNSQLQESTLSKYYSELATKQQELQRAKLSGLDTSGIEAEISLIQNLISQYEGATSAYQKWLDAQSGGEAGDAYDSIQTALKRGKELLDSDLVGTNEFRAIANLFSYEDLSTAPIDKLVEAYNNARPVVEGFFTEGKEGAQKFIDYLDNNNLAKTWVDDAGNEMIKFENNVEEVAKALGISSDLVTMIYQKLGDYGFDTSFLNTSDMENAVKLISDYQSALDSLDGSGAAAALDEVTEKLLGLNQDTLIELGFDVDEDGLVTADEIKEKVGTVEIESDVSTNELPTSDEISENIGTVEVDIEGSDTSVLEDTEPKVTVIVNNLSDLEKAVEYYDKIKDSPETTITLNLSLDSAQLSDAQTMDETIKSINENLPEGEKSITIVTTDEGDNLANANKLLEGLKEATDTNVNIITVDENSNLQSLSEKVKDLQGDSSVNVVIGLQDASDAQGTVDALIQKCSEDATLTLTLNDNELKEYKAEGISVTAKVDSVDETNMPDETKKSLSSKAKVVLDESGMPTVTTKNVYAKAVIKDVDDNAVKDYKPEDKEAKAVYSVDDSAVQEYEVADKDGTVNEHVNDDEVKAYDPEDKDGTAIYGVDDDAVQSYVAPDKTPDAIYQPNLSNLPETLPAIEREVIYREHGGASGGFATGTFYAHASGTAYNTVNAIPAYSGGRKVALDKNETAVVNELGTEMLIRNGKAMLLPGGIHMEQLKKGDIILNHKQTEAILNGKVLPEHVRALASGTWNAYNNLVASGSGHRRIGYYSSSSSSGGYSSSPSYDYTPEDYTQDVSDAMELSAEAVESTADAVEEATEEEKTAFEKFKDWVGSFFDWTEKRIENLNKRIEKTAQQAEKAADRNDYVKTIEYYDKAITLSTEQINNQLAAASKYQAKAEEILNRAVGTEGSGVDSALASEIRIKIENGDLDIGEYSEEVREVISSYQSWAEKAYKAKDAVDELHESIDGYVSSMISYVDKMKSTADSTMESKLGFSDLFTSIGGGFKATSNRAKYGQLKASDEQIRRENQAYSDRTDTLYSGLKNVRGTAINAIKANKETNAEYNKALEAARKNMNNGRKIDDAVIDTVAKTNPTMAGYLTMYNKAQDNYQTVALEEVVKIAENSALKSQNTSNKFDNIDAQLNKEISDLEKKSSSGDVTGSQANRILDSLAKRQSQATQNARAKADSFRTDENKARNEITKKQSVKGVNYAGLLPKAKQNVNNICQAAVNAAKSGVAIDATTLSNIAKFAGEGLITVSFLQACLDYNNALEYRLEAEEAAEIAEETEKQRLAEIGAQKVSNISDAYAREREDYKISDGSRTRDIAARSAKGEDTRAEEYQQKIDEGKANYKSYSAEAKALEEQIWRNIDSGVWSKESKEYREAAAHLEEVKQNANDAGVAVVEYGNKLESLKLEVFDKQIERLETIKNLLDSVINLNAAKGNYGNDSQYKKVTENLRQQAKVAGEKKRDADWKANKAKTEGTYQGLTYDQWMSKGNSENAGKVTYRGRTYNDYVNDSYTYDAQRNNYNAQAYENEKARKELPLDELDDQLDLIDGDLNLIMKDADLSELRGQLADASLLEEKRNKLLEEQAVRNARIAELENLIKNAKGDKERNEYLAELKKEQGALKDVDKELVSVNQAIINLDFEKLERAIGLFENAANRMQSTMNRKQAEGHYLTEEDWDTYTNSLRSAAEGLDEEWKGYLENRNMAAQSPDGLYKEHDYKYWDDMYTQKFTAAQNKWAEVAQAVEESGNVASVVINDTLSTVQAEAKRIGDENDLKEQSGQYLTIQDIQKELAAQQAVLAEQERLQKENQEKYDNAIAEGREADAAKYKKAIEENGSAIAQTKTKIDQLSDAIRNNFTTAINAAITNLQNKADELNGKISVLEAQGEDATAEKKQKAEVDKQISEKQLEASNYLQSESDKERGKGNDKKADDLANQASSYKSGYYSSLSSYYRTYSELNKSSSDSSSSSKEEDTIADKLKRELDILDAQYNILKTRQDLLEAQGKDLSSSDYRERIEAINERIAKNEELVKANLQLSKQAGNDDKKAKEYLKAAKDAEAQTLSLKIEIQKLGDEMRKSLVDNIDKVIDRLKLMMDAFETINSFISTEMMYNAGQLTDYGITSLAMLVKQYEVSNEYLEELLRKRQQYIDEYANGSNEYYSEKEFVEDMAKVTGEIQNVAKNAVSLQNKIVDATIKSAQEQAKAITDVIDKRKELLQSQKDYYSFDRTLKQKTNDLANLEKQRDALSQLTDKESRAKLQKINKQISDAREDLQETFRDHSIDLQIQGLDDLKESINKNLEDTSKAMKSNVESIVSTVESATASVNSAVGSVETTITKLLNSLGVEGLTKEAIGYTHSYAGGTVRHPGGSARINENGLEMLFLPDGSVLVPDLPVGSSVLNAESTRRLMDMARNGFSSFKPNVAMPRLNNMSGSKGTEIKIGDIKSNFVIQEANDPNAVIDAIQKNARIVANTVSEQMLKGVNRVGTKRSWG